ncbi:hypothetical protein CALCODRAFT_194461 [Calocera cornea HHB12733]|uniref:Uncharacterized protein n=1 Tax=Calocera cornea HHB12733 TaxID=1353952 RepID=A0A165HI78_9BASI|nr:hypothetical protein CALCODRAFT_194461 [Calocera cornea HHB12733]
MMYSLGMQPVPFSPAEGSYISPELARSRSPKEQSRSPRIPRQVPSPVQRDPAPQMRTVSYHKMNGEHRKPERREEHQHQDVALREALERAAQTLSLPIAALDGATSAPARSPNPYEPRSLDDVVRAMDFLRSADSLIWKGRRETGRMSGRAGDSVFAEENVQALRERLGMWERVVRSKR